VSFCMLCARIFARAYVLINTPSYRTKVVLVCVDQIGYLSGCVCDVLVNDF
jgi:hypothetical protein